jgi:DNA-binding HxlR family transcriptional regulator
MIEASHVSGQWHRATRVDSSTVLGRDYATQNCSIARTLEIVGERWTLLVLREAFLGTRRFDEFQGRLGIARNVLQSRLERLTGDDLLERHRYRDRPPRYEYRLTDAGRDLLPVLIALMGWGDRHRAPAGPPALILHEGCGGAVDAALGCDRCGAEGIGPAQIAVVEGPGAMPGAPLGLMAAPG